MEQRPRVGIGVMILKGNKILLGKRRGSHGEGEYAFPGGHLEYMESFAQCVEREIAEETGLKIQNIKFQFLANLTQYAPKHYVHIGVTADWKSGEPQLLEPDKCESWGWYDINPAPQPLFVACTMAIQCYKTGNNYIDCTPQL